MPIQLPRRRADPGVTREVRLASGLPNLADNYRRLGREIGQAGREVSQGVAQMARENSRQQRQRDTTTAKQATIAHNQLWGQWKEEALARTGIETDDLIEERDKKWQEIYDKLDGVLENDDQRRMFSMAIGNDKANEFERLGRHYQRQQDVARGQADTALIAQAQDAISLTPNAETYDLKKQEAFSAMGSLYRDAPPEVKKFHQDNWKNQTNSRVVLQLLNSGDTAGAEKWLQTYAGEMKGDTVVNLREKLDRKNTTISAIRRVDREIIASMDGPEGDPDWAVARESLQAQALAATNDRERMELDIAIQTLDQRRNAMAQAENQESVTRRDRYLLEMSRTMDPAARRNILTNAQNDRFVQPDELMDLQKIANTRAAVTQEEKIAAAYDLEAEIITAHAKTRRGVDEAKLKGMLIATGLSEGERERLLQANRTGRLHETPYSKITSVWDKTYARDFGAWTDLDGEMQRGIIRYLEGQTNGMSAPLTQEEIRTYLAQATMDGLTVTSEGIKEGVLWEYEGIPLPAQFVDDKALATSVFKTLPSEMQEQLRASGAVPGIPAYQRFIGLIEKAKRAENAGDTEPVEFGDTGYFRAVPKKRASDPRDVLRRRIQERAAGRYVEEQMRIEGGL